MAALAIEALSTIPRLNLNHELKPFSALFSRDAFLFGLVQEYNSEGNGSSLGKYFEMHSYSAQLRDYTLDLIGMATDAFPGVTIEQMEEKVRGGIGIKGLDASRTEAFQKLFSQPKPQNS